MMKFFGEPKKLGISWITTDDGKFFDKIDEITRKYNKGRISLALARFWNKVNPTILLLKKIVHFSKVGKRQVAVLSAGSRAELEKKIKETERIFNDLIDQLEKHYKDKRYRD